MRIAGVIGVGVLAGAAALGLAVVSNVWGLPDLSNPAPPQDAPQQQAAVKPAQPEPAPPAGVAAGTAPSIDVLRAEEDGSFVVAGRATPGGTVELKDRDGTVVAKGQVDPTGDFVLLSQENLSAGSHELRLHENHAGSEGVSQEAALVSIPEQAEAAVLAAVIPKNAPVSVNTPAPATPQTSAPAPAPVVAVEAVEVENDTLAVAGAVEKGATVQVYLDNKPIGRATGTADGRFLLETQKPLAPGRHDVRADVINRTDGTVIARAAVPVLHKTAEQVEEAAALQTGSSVIIRGGDSLWRISRRTYGAGIRYTTIFAANRDQIRDPDRIYIGQIFKLPTGQEVPDD